MIGFDALATWSAPVKKQRTLIIGGGLLFGSGCSGEAPEPPVVPPDAGTTADSGVSADAGLSPADTGSIADSGPLLDSGVVTADSGTPDAGSAPPDAGAPAAPPSNGDACTDRGDAYCAAGQVSFFCTGTHWQATPTSIAVDPTATPAVRALTLMATRRRPAASNPRRAARAWVKGSATRTCAPRRCAKGAGSRWRTTGCAATASSTIKGTCALPALCPDSSGSIERGNRATLATASDRARGGLRSV